VTLHDALAAAARRARDTETAHLLRLMPGGTATAELHGRDDVLMLDTYRDKVDLDGVYGEAELRMLYCADFPLRDLAACRPEDCPQCSSSRAPSGGRLPAGIGPRRYAAA
jgi:hypothetical protein